MTSDFKNTQFFILKFLQFRTFYCADTEFEMLFQFFQ